MTARRIMVVADCEDDIRFEEVVWRRLAPFFARGASIDALLVRCSRQLCARFAAQGIHATLAQTNGTPGWSAIRHLAAMARASRATVFYAHGEYAHMLCALTGPLLGVPVIAHLLREASLADAHAWALCRSTVIVPTDYARSQALAVGCGDVVVVATPSRFGAGAAAAQSVGTALVGWAGAWHDDDDPELFLRAAAAVTPEVPRVRFVMSLPAARAASLSAAFAHRMLVVPLRFGAHGFASNLDLYVHTARRDALHLTLVDALGAGLPVVATTAGGSIEVLASGAWASSSAHLYRPGDERALIRALKNACEGLDARLHPPGRDAGHSSLDQAAMSVDAILDRRVTGALSRPPSFEGSASNGIGRA